MLGKEGRGRFVSSKIVCILVRIVGLSWSVCFQIKALLADMFTSRKICDSVNPDEVVSYGAAVQASILSGASEKLLVDVTNFSLGTNTKGDVMVSDHSEV